jgi:hypothetical protein
MRGVVVLSAERVAGFTAMSTTSSTTTTFASSSSSVSVPPPVKQDVDESSTGLNLLWNAGASNPFAIPRLAIDGFVGPQVTLGGSAGYISRGGHNKTTSSVTVPGSGTTSSIDDNDLPDVSAFVLSPRLGVVITLGPKVAFWLRGGVTYFQTSLDSTRTAPPTTSGGPTTTSKVEGEASGTAITLDGQLVIVPIDHVGITLGPVLDIGVGGSTKTTTVTTTGSAGSSQTTTRTTEGDVTQSNYGAAAGIVAFF